jgi:hypothetical protein
VFKHRSAPELPDCGSFGVSFPDGRENIYFYWDDNPGPLSAPPPMNIVTRNGGGYLGFRPENFPPREMINNGNGGVAAFSFRVDRSEYLGSERIVYGVLDGFDSKLPITAKLPPALVA